MTTHAYMVQRDNIGLCWILQYLATEFAKKRGTNAEFREDRARTARSSSEGGDRKNEQRFVNSEPTRIVARVAF